MKKDELVFIKLVSNGYVVGKVVDEDDGQVKLKKPLSVVFEPMMGGLQILPYDAFYLGKEMEELSFKTRDIMHVFEGDDIPAEIQGKYIEFETGIVTQTEAPQPNEDELAKALGI